jgi:DNA topoisomerase III
MNYDFTYPQLRSDFTVTSVSGHLTSSDFGDAHRQWNSCDSFSLFDVPVVVNTSTDAKDIGRNLTNEAKYATTLMIWTDCDREGEHIGLEIANVCRQAKRDLVVRRARFSAIIAA